jgi:hypothetical protein
MEDVISEILYFCLHRQDKVPNLKNVNYFLIAIKPMPESKFHGFVQMVCDITNNCDDRKNGTSRGRCKELLKLAESFLN